MADCPVLHLGAGSVIDEARSPCLYVVLRGALQSMPEDAQAGEGARKILPGECVGELSVLNEEPGGERLSALEDSELLAIDAATLWTLIDESNGVARNLLRMLSFRLRAANAQLRRRRKVGEFFRQMSMADGLTGLHNRAWLDESLPAMVAAAHANRQPLSLIMVDLDHFKDFNDRHGHQLGDRALKAAAQALIGALRPSDFAARYGGEELTVILPGARGDIAQAVAERLLQRIRAAQVVAAAGTPQLRITASLGVATLAPDQSADALLAAADAALYRAKQDGRDRVAAQELQ